MRIEKRATVISSFTAFILVILKMSVALISGSVAVLASAIDSLLDFSVSMFNYFALSHAEKEADEKFNFGRSKIEPLAAAIEGTIIVLSAVFIFYEAIQKIINNEQTQLLRESIFVMLASIIITVGLVLFLNYVAKKTNNLVIKADALHYKTDLYSNAGVLLALILVQYTGENLIDSVLGILIALYMIYSAIPILKEGVLMLLDAALPQEEVAKIEHILNTDHKINGYHFLQTRESGSDVFISVHLVFDIETSLYDAHLVGDKIEAQIKKLFESKTAHITIHLDPYDDSDINEVENHH